ncbi:MAG: hypothetical protein IJ864_00230 [Alphaproteobacteria bacterium]|nr:hypothetical protein [Alphaproteobacteria bacterium]
MIRKYLFHDALKVILQPEQAAEAAEFACFFDDIKSYTLVDDNGGVLAVFGYRLASALEAECFALIGANCGKKMLSLVRFLQTEIPLVMQKKCLNRAIFTVQKNFAAAYRLAVLLGFHCVAELPNFYLNIDYLLFERKIK